VVGGGTLGSPNEGGAPHISLLQKSRSLGEVPLPNIADPSFTTTKGKRKPYQMA